MGSFTPSVGPANPPQIQSSKNHEVINPTPLFEPPSFRVVCYVAMDTYEPMTASATISGKLRAGKGLVHRTLGTQLPCQRVDS